MNNVELKKINDNFLINSCHYFLIISQWDILNTRSFVFILHLLHLFVLQIRFLNLIVFLGYLSLSLDYLGFVVWCLDIMRLTPPFTLFICLFWCSDRLFLRLRLLYNFNFRLVLNFRSSYTYDTKSWGIV